MFKIKSYISLAFILFISGALVGCNNETVDTGEKSEDIQVEDKDSETHYLKFIENNAEILRIVVLENETYEDYIGPELLTSDNADLTPTSPEASE